MNWIEPAAKWLRDALAQQRWLDAWQPTIAATPDWALLLAGPGALLLIWIVLRVVWGRRSRVDAPDHQSEPGEANSHAMTTVVAPPPQAPATPVRAVTSPAPPPDPPIHAEVHSATTPTGATENKPETSNSNDTEVSEYLHRLRDPDLHKADESVMVAAGHLSGVFGVEDKKKAIAAYERAVANDPKLSHAWHQLGILYGEEDRDDASKHAFEKALTTAANAGEEGVALCSLGSIANEQEDYALAEDLYTRAVQKLEGAQDEIEVLVQCTRALASVKYRRGASDAERAIQNARVLAQSHGFPKEELQCLHWLIGIARAQHKPSVELEPLLNAALPLERQVGRKEDQARTLRMLGEIARSRGDTASWCSHNEAALSLSRELGDQEGMALALCQAGRIARDSRDADTAFANFRESLSIAEKIGDKKFIVEVLNQLGDLEYQCDKLDNAAGYLDRALTIAGQIGDASGQASALYTLGCVAEDRGDHQEKKFHWTKAKERAQAAGDAAMVQNIDHFLREADETITRSLRHERERESYKGVCTNAGEAIYRTRPGSEEWMPSEWDRTKFELHRFQDSQYRNILICLECGKFIGSMASR